MSIYDELVKANTTLIEKDINQMKRSVQSIREQKTKLQCATKHMQHDLSQQVCSEFFTFIIQSFFISDTDDCKTNE